MNKQIYIVIGAIIIILVAAGIYISSKQNGKQEVASETSMAHDETMMKDDSKKSDEAIMQSEDHMMTDDKMSKDGEDKMMTKPGSYKTYSPETVKNEQAAGNKVVLFFYASWCPYCQAADKAFNENLEKIPAGVTLLKTDYDSNKDLKTKYGVTYQHTFVQIDNNGNQITKWNGGDIDNLIKYLK